MSATAHPLGQMVRKLELWQPLEVDPGSAFHRAASALGIARLRAGVTPTTPIVGS